MKDEPKEDAPSPPPSLLASWLDPKLIVPFIQAIVILLVGWWIKDGVTLALEQKQLDLANVKEMRDLMLSLSKAGQEPDEYNASAIALAPFGTYTIVPFLQLVQDGGDSQALAAETGLRIVAIQNPKPVSAELQRILHNRSRLYTWRAHVFAARTLGEMGDCKALPALDAYWSALGGAAASDSTRILKFTAMVRDDQKPSAAQTAEMVSCVRSSIVALRGAQR